MSSTDQRRDCKRLIDLTKIIEALKKNWMLWMAPAIAFTIVGVLYAFTKTDRWNASQALIVRDEAIGEIGFDRAPLGRFDSNDSLKRSLETILQIAKNRTVVGEALKAIGPEKKSKKEFPL